MRDPATHLPASPVSKSGAEGGHDARSDGNRIFVSHSSHDGLAANSVVSALESQGFAIWIAPRNVPAGANWSAEILDAIQGCGLVLLLLSNQANQSEQVASELERAQSLGRPRIVVRLENIEPSPLIRFFVCRHQWFDAFPHPIERWLPRLADAVRSLLSHYGRDSVGDFRILGEGPLRRAPNGLAYRLYGVVHRDFPDHELQGKCYLDLPPSGDPKSPAFDEMALRHARVTLSVGPHPHIHWFRTTFLDGVRRARWIIEDLLPGERLSTLLERGPLAPASALALLRDVALALVALHAAGFVRRELSPDAIIVAPDGRGVLTDFELAKATAKLPTVTVDGCWARSPYVAPELRDGSMPAEPRVDLFGWGAVLFHALTGTIYEGRTSLALLDRVPLPEGASALVASCLSPVASHRPKTARDLLAALDSIGVDANSRSR